MKSISSGETIEKLRDCIARFGLPDTIVSDNGRQFTSGEFATFCKKNSIKHMTTAPYTPQLNGAAENAVKSFKNGMFKALSDPAKDGISNETLMNRYLFYYRSSVHATTLETPYKLMFGREMRTHFDRIKPSKLSSMCERTEQQQQAVPNTNDKKREFAVNDNVMVRDYRSKNHKWQKAIIKSTIGNRMYKCSTADGEWRRHANQIIPAKMVKSNLIINNDHFSSIDRFSIDNNTPTSNDVEPLSSATHTSRPDDTNSVEPSTSGAPATESVNQPSDQEYFTDEDDDTQLRPSTSSTELANSDIQTVATKSDERSHVLFEQTRNSEANEVIGNPAANVSCRRSGRKTQKPDRLAYE